MIRTVRDSDIQKIAETHVASWQSTYVGLVQQAYLDDLSVSRCMDSWSEALADPNHSMLACELNGDIVGFSSYGPSRDQGTGSDVGELYSIYLIESSTGHGIGTTLWDQSYNNMRDLNFNQITLWVLSSNQRARRFYEKMGFELDGGEKVLEIWDQQLLELRYRFNCQ